MLPYLTMATIIINKAFFFVYINVYFRLLHRYVKINYLSLYLCMPVNKIINIGLSKKPIEQNLSILYLKQFIFQR